MSQTAVLWDTKMMFHRLVEDASGCPTDAVTPLMLSAPFFRGRYAGILIPTGFGNTSYSRLLPALRACSGRIEEYLEAGGRMLVFGAADASPARYDWLPVEVEYHFAFMEHALDIDDSSRWSSLFSGYDTEAFACDGWFEHAEGKPVAVSRDTGKPVFVECRVGKGTLLLASTHEYPSDAFLKMFAAGETIPF
ncbi:MAG: hypothetical protein Q4Q04_02810 [Methanocorpusculum sp.]|nr:hypothetical protein [Methanocorpusculum sp.]